MQEMVIYGVSFDMVGKQPIVLLKAVDTNKFLPIWIGHPRAPDRGTYLEVVEATGSRNDESPVLAGLSAGGRSRTRTWDLFLIREAL